SSARCSRKTSSRTSRNTRSISSPATSGAPSRRWPASAPARSSVGRRTRSVDRPRVAVQKIGVGGEPRLRLSYFVLRTFFYRLGALFPYWTTRRDVRVTGCEFASVDADAQLAALEWPERRSLACRSRNDSSAT